MKIRFGVVTKSRSGHVLSWLNMGGPSSKAKYSLLTDSEPVPWGKGEKNPNKGSEKIWNRMCTSSGSLKYRRLVDRIILCCALACSINLSTAFVLGRLRTFCIMGQRLTLSSKLNRWGEAKGNRVLIGRLVARSRPETERSSHGQGESSVTWTGGPNPLMLKN